MWTHARRALSTFPITAAYVLIAVVLFLAVETDRHRHGTRADVAREKYGAIGQQFNTTPELHGPLALWNGQWWRVPVSPFHHGNWVHLILNVLSIWYLGSLLEPKLRKPTYLACLLLGTTVSVLPDFLVENYVIGLSGGACAMFGMLMILRRVDPSVNLYFDRTVEWGGLGWLAVCVLLTQFGLVPVANLTHATGLAYGLLAGGVCFTVWGRRPSLRTAFCLAHLLIVPALYFAVHPVWNARYHWHAATRAGDPSQTAARLERALVLDPDLEGQLLFPLAVARAREGRLEQAWESLEALSAQLPHGAEALWWRLAATCIREGELPAAWRTVLEGLRRHQASIPGLILARSIWSAFGTPEQQAQARKILADVFQQEASAWQLRLMIAADTNAGERPAAAPDDRLNIERGLTGIGPSPDREPLAPRNLTAPQVNPDSPESAAAGVRL
jgi:rhomboid protease GluP